MLDYLFHWVISNLYYKEEKVGKWSRKCFIYLLIYLFILKGKGHKGHLHRSKNYSAKIQIESPHHT